jgi:hypothetical protein
MPKRNLSKANSQKTGLLLKGQGATIKAKMFCRGIPSIDNSRDYPMVDHKGTPKF